MNSDRLSRIRRDYDDAIAAGKRVKVRPADLLELIDAFDSNQSLALDNSRVRAINDLLRAADRANCERLIRIEAELHAVKEQLEPKPHQYTVEG